MRVEITEPLDLDDAQVAQIAHHSFLNLLNVLVTELSFLRKLSGKDDALRESLALCMVLRDSFLSKETALREVGRIESFRKQVLREVSAAFDGITLSSEYRDMFEESLRNLARVLEVAGVRVRELLARQEAGGDWIEITPERLREDMQQVLDAIAENSKGRFRIVYSLEEQSASDYLVAFDLQCAEGQATFMMPAVFKDVIRDLTANARKYTGSGGKITVRLHATSGTLSLAVSDTGRGIPENQIASVVGFGVRATNTRPEETKGGGFGLTKAYFVCRQFGGRMWIDSSEGRGTTVRIDIPRMAP